MMLFWSPGFALGAKQPQQSQHGIEQSPPIWYFLALRCEREMVSGQGFYAAHSVMVALFDPNLCNGRSKSSVPGRTATRSKTQGHDA
jgi:hypothetical protein